MTLCVHSALSPSPELLAAHMHACTYVPPLRTDSHARLRPNHSNALLFQSHFVFPWPCNIQLS
jgi:hypothetical protein